MGLSPFFITANLNGPFLVKMSVITLLNRSGGWVIEIQNVGRGFEQCLQLIWFICDFEYYDGIHSVVFWQTNNHLNITFRQDDILYSTIHATCFGRFRQSLGIIVQNLKTKQTYVKKDIYVFEISQIKLLSLTVRFKLLLVYIGSRRYDLRSLVAY